MATPILYPVGIQTFSKIIENGFVYADKTEIIHNLVRNLRYVFLSRPRRFGKSLLLSTLEAYFQGRKELFKGLDIYDMEDKWEKHPVLRLDLSGESFDAPDKLDGKINSILERWEKEYGIKPVADSGKSLSVRFSEVIRAACISTGSNVVVLIDEYDKPLLENLYNKELFEESRRKLRGFYSVLKECDEFIEFAMMTGVTKFAQLSVFSGLNNLTDITFDKRYNSVCGFTEKEMRRYFSGSISNFAGEHEISEEKVWEIFKENYDGYHFHESGEDVYNPYSVLRAFESGEIDEYWYSTGNPQFLVNVLREEGFPLNDLDNAERSKRELEDLTIIHGDIVPLFFQSGYLTIKRKNQDTGLYILGFPNREVKKAFWTTLSINYFPKIRSSSDFNLNKFRNDLIEGNIEGFLIRMKSLFATRNPGPESNLEVHFENMMAIFTMLLGFEVNTQILNDKGRTDMTVMTCDYIYIMEFKVDSDPQTALSQIKEKAYSRRYEADGRKKYIVGVNFSSEERNIDGWSVEEICS